MIDEGQGSWLAEHLGVALDAPDDLRGLVGLALRRNTRRAHLPVSLVLGKHVPTDPRTVLSAAHRLAALVATTTAARDAVVLGFAENATGLAHLVAEAIDAEHLLHSTRRVVPGAATLGEFDERHSHGRRHLLLPDHPERWRPDAPLVLVDDELSTGHTVATSLRVLQRARPRERYVVAALVDLRGPGDDAVSRAAAELGVRVDVVALARGVLRRPPDELARAAALVAAHSPSPPPPLWREGVLRDHHRLDGRRRDAGPGARRPGTVETLRLPLAGAPEGARHGLDRADRAALEAAVPAAAAALDTALGTDPGRVLVLGCEELHHLPVRLAAALADAGRDVAVAGTTRSPIVVVDDPGYPVRSALSFPAHDAGLGPSRERYAYGLGDGGSDTVVLVVDDAARTPTLHRGLVPALREVASRVVEAVVPTRGPRRGAPGVPALRGPAFGTFAPDEVAWLLSDLSGAVHPTPPAEREEVLRSGRRHYSETLPEEHAPDAEYDGAAARALERAADGVATAVGHLTARILAATSRPVLVSLARAGTPVGVLVRRWAARVRGVELPHYSCSVVRGRGLDPAALAALTAAHDPSSLVFLDGWTGTGSIVDEVAPLPVAALADPAHCARLYGTRDDLLVPSACLTATVCGLVSRTLRRPDLMAPGGYDGAVFHLELADADRTAAFLDAVTACFRPSSAPGADPPDRRGPRYAGALARERGCRVKAGVGETTRALLRRAPTTVLLAPDADLDHLRLLCRRRGVPVADLPAAAGGVACPYRAVALLPSEGTGFG